MLASLKKLIVESSDALVGPLGGHGVVELQLPVEDLVVHKLHCASGKELTKLLIHLPTLSELVISSMYPNRVALETMVMTEQEEQDQL